MAGKKNIARAIIEATVDRGLKELDEDPHRSIRKLNDLGRQFADGRFMPNLYSIFNDFLKNDDSPYYPAIEHVFHQTNRKALVTFGVNIGYSSFTKGGKKLREVQAEKGFNIPWAVTVRIDPSVSTSVTPAELSNMIKEGTELGIYTYMLRLSGSLSGFDELCEVCKLYPECAFLVVMPDAELSAPAADILSSCINIMSFYWINGDYSDANTLQMRRKKSWYGTYGYYNDSNVKGVLSHTGMRKFMSQEGAFVLTIASDDASEKVMLDTAEQVKQMRLEPVFPLFIFDAYGDAISINKVISGTECFFEIMEDRSIHTQRGSFPASSDDRSLLDMFEKYC